MRIRLRDPESFLTLDPGWKISDPGFGINIPDSQHCCKQTLSRLSQILFDLFDSFLVGKVMFPYF
jgi:hypothetical protein